MKCSKCGQDKSSSDFYKCDNRHCKECHKGLSREYYLKNRKKILENHKRNQRKNWDEHLKKCREYRYRLRMKVLIHYGGNPPKCSCRGCNETKIKFLTIDHIEGGGTQHRKQLSLGNLGRGRILYQWLKNNNFPEGYQVLCYNCNQGRAHNNGICPHIKTDKYLRKDSNNMIEKCNW